MIPALILAGGASTRMGRPKALLPVARGGASFIAHLLQTFSDAGVDDLLVVVGANADAVAAAVGALPRFVRVVQNRSPERGQLSSLVTGLDVADRPGVRAVLVMPVDIPLVASSTIRAVLGAYRTRSDAFGESRRHPSIVRPIAEDGRHGHPVLFDRAVFAELRGADLAKGARAVVAAHAGDVLDVPVRDPGAFEDIDTPEDYERCTGLRLPD